MATNVLAADMNTISAAPDKPEPEYFGSLSAWCPRDCDFVIDRRRVTGGLVYVGIKMAAVSTARQEPSMINPHLPVDWSSTTFRADSHISSYADLKPEARAGYLAWLASGRSRQSISEAFLRIFLAGLERRFLHDLDSDTSNEECTVLRQELSRLVRHYGDYPFVLGKIRQILTVMDALHSMRSGEDIKLAQIDAADANSALLLKIAIGQNLKATDTISAELAWRAATLLNRIMMPSPAIRHPEVFKTHFLYVYGTNTKAALKKPRVAQKLNITYSTVSPGFSGFQKWNTGLADVAESEQWIQALSVFLSNTNFNLHSYARKADSHGADDLAALSFLYPQVLRDLNHPTIARLQEHFESVLSGQPAVTTVLEFCTILGPQYVEKFGKNELRSAITVLQSLDLSVMLDRSLSVASALKHDRLLAVHLCVDSKFANLALVDQPPLKEICSAARLLSLVTSERSVFTHVTDGIPSEWSAVLDAIWSIAVASDAQPLRLKTLCQNVGDSLRDRLAAKLAEILRKQNPIDTEALKLVLKIYEHWEISEDTLYQSLHSRTEATPSNGTSDTTKSLSLDAAKITATLADTEAAAHLLSTVFAEDDSELPETADQNNESDTTDPNSAWLGFAAQLSQQDEWGRSEAEAIANQHGFPFLDAAIESINEHFLALCHEPLLEGFDPIEVNMYAWQTAFETMAAN